MPERKIRQGKSGWIIAEIVHQWEVLNRKLSFLTSLPDAFKG
jgi:hypothetical protein